MILKYMITYTLCRLFKDSNILLFTEILQILKKLIVMFFFSLLLGTIINMFIVQVKLLVDVYIKKITSRNKK